MDPETLETFTTGTRKVQISLELYWHRELCIKVSDGGSNFTSFSVSDRNEGRMKGEFLAGLIRGLRPKKRRRSRWER